MTALTVDNAAGVTITISQVADGNGNVACLHATGLVTGGVVAPVTTSNPLPVVLPTGFAQDGTDATGVAAPAGGVGIRGWLSGIYSKLTTSIAVTGTFWQATQPVSIAATVAVTDTAAETALATIITNTALAASVNAAFQGVVPFVPGTAQAVQRSVGYILTSAGNVTLTLADGSAITLSLPVSAQFQTLPFAATAVTLSGGAAGSFWNMK